MDEIIQKIQTAMNILCSIRPRVDQVNDITIPLVNVNNLLADVRDSLTEKVKENTVANDTEG